MKRERRQPTKAELASITSSRPVVRKIAPLDKDGGPAPNGPGESAEAKLVRGPQPDYDFMVDHDFMPDADHAS